MKKRGVLAAFTNPVDGREEEYNKWYNNTHIADVLDIPGVVAAKRYRLANGQHVDGYNPWKYLAIYEIECDDISSVAEELKIRRGPTGKGSPGMFISPALADERLAWFFEEILNLNPRNDARAIP